MMRRVATRYLVGESVSLVVVTACNGTLACVLPKARTRALNTNHTHIHRRSFVIVQSSMNKLHNSRVFLCFVLTVKSKRKAKHIIICCSFLQMKCNICFLFDACFCGAVTKLS